MLITPVTRPSSILHLDHNPMRDPHHRLMIDTSDSKGNQQIDCQLCDLQSQSESHMAVCSQCKYKVCSKCVKNYVQHNHQRSTETRRMYKFPCFTCNTPVIMEKSVVLFVEITQGHQSILTSRTVRMKPSGTFASLLDAALQYAHQQPRGYNSGDFQIAVTINTKEAGAGHIVDLDDTYEDIVTSSNMKFVAFAFSLPINSTTLSTPLNNGATPRNAFTIMMKDNRRHHGFSELLLPFPQAESNSSRGPLKLHNAIIRLMQQKHLGVTTRAVANSEVGNLVMAYTLRTKRWGDTGGNTKHTGG